ncbi:MAG TPA: hypothetical protein VF476_18755 [Chitinophagaceae bacterium]
MTATASKSLQYFLSTSVNVVLLLTAVMVLTNLVRLIRHIIAKPKPGSKFSFYFIKSSSLLLIFCFSFLGLSIGLLVGLSQSPVVHVTIPALLTFYGGFITYLFAKDSFKDEESRLATILSAIAVSCFLLYGVELGSTEKNAAIKSAKEFDLKYLQEELRIRQLYPVK